MHLSKSDYVPGRPHDRPSSVWARGPGLSATAGAQAGGSPGLAGGCPACDVRRAGEHRCGRPDRCPAGRAGCRECDTSVFSVGSCSGTTIRTDDDPGIGEVEPRRALTGRPPGRTIPDPALRLRPHARTRSPAICAELTRSVLCVVKLLNTGASSNPPVPCPELGPSGSCPVADPPPRYAPFRMRQCEFPLFD